ncbi:hypothetical protein PROFUN_09612 [Planoprotostelium fungivorum]|uniref:Replication factor A protein 3 n=1 Tax=Planoprotostelium fungivorum TaxID=1890364 RepID=A0A2P6MNX9_9EUKA|nr:hypothetical protein PROFUN_09612 [Planoprotostelium fungivorum]
MAQKQIIQPRINYTYMDNFINFSVRLVGQVRFVDPDQQVTVVAALDGDIKVVDSTCLVPVNNFVEIAGKVNPDRTLSEQIAVNFGTNFDLQTYNDALALWHANDHLFYGNA